MAEQTHSTSGIESAFEQMQALLLTFAVPQNFNKIHQAGQIMAQALKQGNQVLSCGNGGSMADAMHFAEELSGRYRQDRPALPALAPSDPTYLTCVANDYGYDFVFARFIEAFGKSGDVLLAISTSGNSPNVVHAAAKARTKGISVVALTGNDGGRLAALADVEIRVPHNGYADRIQEIHIKVIHCLIQTIESLLFNLPA